MGTLDAEIQNFTRTRKTRDVLRILQVI